MLKKRKLQTKANTHKSSPVEIIVEDVSSHPLCLHGPTLLFSTERGRFFACALCRNKKECTVRIREEDWQNESVQARNEKYMNMILKIDKFAAWKKFHEVSARHYTDRAYCDSCQELFIPSQVKRHQRDHKVTTPLSDDQLARPSSWLPLLEDDAKEAQYLFAKKSISTVLGILRNNGISNILCVGTPSIHEAAQADLGFNSILLDYDTRYHLFNPSSKFLWYNMFNDYLFTGVEDERVLNSFFQHSRAGGLCIVIDPPFGGRVEPLVHTLKELSAKYRNIHEEPQTDLLPIIWAFPYFAEPYIKNVAPEIQMHDYQVEYENHKKFQAGKQGRKFGSPVRFFTNLPFNTIDLSNDSNYKRCEKCKYWVSKTNNHCDKCKECTSKNGMTYKHCNICNRCVKPTFVHCDDCTRCVLEKGHECGAVVKSQSCHKCNEKGHKQSECPQNKKKGGAKKKKH